MHGASGFEANSAQSHGLKDEERIKSSAQALCPAPFARFFPVLRGYSGDRFLITENGAEIGDLSQTSVDHALSMDLGGVEQIEIVRGPRTLLFGSNSISGVIDIQKNKIPVVEFDHMHTYLTSGYETGNQGFFNNFSVLTPIQNNNLRFSLSHRKAGDQQTPQGTLKNTSLNTTEGFIGLTRFKGHKRGTISIEHITMDYGIPGSLGSCKQVTLCATCSKEVAKVFCKSSKSYFNFLHSA